MGDFSFSFRKKPEGSAGGPPKISAAEEQFNQLRGCGLNLDGHKTLKQVIAGHEEGAFEQSPYALLLALMGGSDEAGAFWSHDVWLYTPGEEMSLEELAGIASNLSRLTKGALPIEDVQAGANEESGEIQLAFTLDGEQTGAAFDPAQTDVVGGIIATIASLAAERGEGSRLAFADIEGLGRLFVFLNEDEIGELAETTSIPFAVVE